MKEALLSIEKRQSEGCIASIIRGLGEEIGGLSDSDRGKVENTVMKWLKDIKVVMAKGTRASALLSMILDETWPIAVPGTEEAAEEAGTDTDSDAEITIPQPLGAFSSTPDTMPAILQQMTTFTALVQNQQNDIDRLKQQSNRAGTPDLISSLLTAVTNVESDEDEIETAPRKKKRRK